MELGDNAPVPQGGNPVGGDAGKNAPGAQSSGIGPNPGPSGSHATHNQSRDSGQKEPVMLRAGRVLPGRDGKF